MIARVILALCLLVAPARSPAAEADPPAAPLLTGQAVALDGDTLLLDGARVSLFGIAAPEITAPGGPQARAALDKLLRPGGGAVVCQVVHKDRTKRPVALCRTADTEMDLARALINAGLATPHRLYSHGAKGDPEIAAYYDAAENAARALGIGMWADRGEDTERSRLLELFILGLGLGIAIFTPTWIRDYYDRKTEQRDIARRKKFQARIVASELRCISNHVDRNYESIADAVTAPADDCAATFRTMGPRLWRIDHTAVYGANLTDLALLGEAAVDIIDLDQHISILNDILDMAATMEIDSLVVAALDTVLIGYRDLRAGLPAMIAEISALADDASGNH